LEVCFCKKTPHVTPKKIPISVIVCAKNEAVNVAAFIPLLAEQNYPDFEGVLIDDASNDETLAILKNSNNNTPTFVL
jgi:glycosyltransferase involved in cell wall biosynthesis